MLKPKSRWIVKTQSDQLKTESLAKELNIHHITASLLVNRGLDTVEDARYFLFGQKSQFHDPFLLKDMDKAVARIKQAVETEEQILVYGDYDADGVSSTTVMLKSLLEIGANVDYYIPNRFTEGYGPNELAFKKAAERGIGLIITVDTGISAIHEAQVAIDLGLDLIITDHHEPGPVLPNAFAIIHPKLEDSLYPFKDLAGVGVALKLAHALLGRLPEHLFEFAAIGTIADLVPLLDENRQIAMNGIAQLKSSQTPGLHALLKLAKIESSAIDEETIGFVIGPRVNAAGRLGSADPAVQLMMTSDPEEAGMLAEEIDALNKQRQQLVSEIAEDAIREVETHYPIKDNTVLVVGKEGWNPGVIGIVASRLAEKFYRPAIVLSFDSEKGVAKGSARSIAGFDLFKNLSTCRDILPHFGGHPMAAGMTLSIDNVDNLRDRLNAMAQEQLVGEDLIPVTNVDAKLSINEITIETIKELGLLSPYGVSNPKPKVLIEKASISTLRKIGSNQTHLKLALEENGVSLDGIGFGFGHLHDHISPSSKLSVIGELSINEWNNLKKPQIFLKDIAVEDWQLFDYRGLKKIEKLPEMITGENRRWILFNPELKNKFSAVLDGELQVIANEDEAQQFEMDSAHIVLLDIPPSKEILEKLFAGKSPSRIYVHFYKENSEFFSTNPTREHFKWYYAFLAKKSPFDLKKLGGELAKHKGWTKETVEFMSKVFFELDFVKISNGLISLQSNVPKRDLTESKTYQHKVQAFTLENELLYSSYEQLKGWFDQAVQESVKNEEAITEWI
jgi:single-stranded-DNA-specific exonuclease